MNKQHFDYLDGWRGAAIVFLLIGHFFPVEGINFGAVGVNLFFVLSGLLMSQLLFVKAVPIPTFYRRRISRIFPAFFVMIAAVTVQFYVSGKDIAWSEVAAAALLINNYILTVGNANMPFGHVWSLSVEEHAYIVLSLVAVWSRHRSGSAGRAVGILASVCAATGIWYWTQFSGRELEFGWWLHSEVSAFGIFMSAALLLMLTNRTIPRLHWTAYPALMVFGIAMHWWSIPAPIRTIFGVGVFALTVNLLKTAPPKVKYCLSVAPLKKIGVWSFSIYLWQQPFYFAHHRDGMPAWLALVLAIGTGICSYYMIEQPTRNFLNARWGAVRSGR